MPVELSQLMKFASQGKFESAEHINASLLFSYGDNTHREYIFNLIKIEEKAIQRYQTAIQRPLKVRLVATIGYCEELRQRYNIGTPISFMSYYATTARRLPNSGFNATAPARRLPTELKPKDVKPVVSFETKEVPEKQSSTTACCNVCYEDINIRNFVRFGCSHEFCSTCSNKLTAMEPKKCVCPLCRKKIERVHITMYEYV